MVETDAKSLALIDAIDRRNRGPVESLIRQLRSPLGVIPFVGAGMSAGVRLEGKGSRFPQWSELIAGLAAGRTIEHEVAGLLASGDFESAASLVDRERPNDLSRSIKDAFDRTVSPQYLRSGALSYLPYLTKGPVITTNYDRVLEQVFTASGKPFDTTIFGPRPDEIVSALHESSHTLIKMHGDCRDRTDRVFTRESYEAAYGTATEGTLQQGRIAGLAWLMFTNRPLLFLGCSLEHDRTVGVLREIVRRLPGIAHYAILAADKSQNAWDAREQKLDEIGVRGLWYYPGHFEEIEQLLREALERSSTTVLIDPQVGNSVVIRLAGSPKSLNEVAANLPTLHPAAKTFDHFPELGAIAKEALAGKLTFFLGAYAGLEQSFLGAEFYQRLATEFDCPPALVGDRTAVAGYIITRYGPDRLWNAIRTEFTARAATPSAIHQLVAALPARWRSSNTSATLCVVTTNYDTLMEEALTNAGEIFRLLYYVDSGPADRPSFLERSPDGIVRRVDNPDNLRPAGRAEHLIVKMNGGMSYFGDIEEYAAVERGAFERLAARLPELLPAYLRRELAARSMLFLGHGLAEPDVRRLIELYAQPPGRIGSWAIQIRPLDPDRRVAWIAQNKIFAAQGLDIVEEDLTRFTAELIVRL